MGEEFYKKYKKNIEQSIALNAQYKDFIVKKDCYHNIWRIVTDIEHTKLLQNNYINLKVAIGYIYLSKFGDDSVLYTSHAFFINDNEEIVDPTIPEQRFDHEDFYYIVKTFSDFQSYINDVLACEYPSLLGNKDYMKLKKEFNEWALKNNIIPFD